MKQFLRSKVSKVSSYVEIFISVLILIMIIIVSISLLRDLFFSIFNSFEINYDKFLEIAISLIIGVEFVKMIAKHTPESTVEVLLFAIARRLVVDHTGSIDIIIGIVAIGLLFAIKKFLYSPNLSDPNGHVLEADTTVKEINRITRSKIPEDGENTIKNIVMQGFETNNKEITEGAYIILYGLKFKVYSMTNGEINTIEVIPYDGKII